jgi:hypothetical protein
MTEAQIFTDKKDLSFADKQIAGSFIGDIYAPMYVFTYVVHYIYVLISIYTYRYVCIIDTCVLNIISNINIIIHVYINTHIYI